MFNLIYCGATSACFELENPSPYYAPMPYTVALNGKKAIESDRNVFSLYGLRPGERYEVEVSMGERTMRRAFTTPGESCALSAKDFGAMGDGQTDDTAAIQRAILLLPEGGRLFLPAGTYRTGPILLKSHMTLELDADAVLLGLTDKAAYPVLPATARNLDDGGDAHFGAFEGLPRAMYAALITAEYAEDISIIGPGAIDGNAQNGTWWQTFRQDPVARPRLCFFNRCRGVRVHGITGRNSASWQFHPYFSDDVAFYDIAVTAPKDSPNTDALDPECCDRVDIVGCRFSVGDDCIAIKSGKLELARKQLKPASRHTIRNCLMEFGHGAVVLGSEISGGVKDLSVTQCLFRQTDRGLRIKTRRGRGDTCAIDGISFDNIRMEGVLTPIVINMWYNCVDPDGNSDYVQSREALPVDDRTPRLGRFSFHNMVCEDAEVAACYVDGLPERPVEAVTLENIRIRFRPDARAGKPSMQTYARDCRKLGLYFENVREVRLRGVTLEGAEGAPLITRQVGKVEQERFEG